MALDGAFERRPARPAAFCLAVRRLDQKVTQVLRGKTAEDVRLLDLLDPVAEAAGFSIVRLRLMGSGANGRRLQVMAERPDGTMPVDACARLARGLSHVLDDADPITGDYLLEVSSPGVDRPLTRLEDFETYEGYEAKLELDRLAEGRKRFRGELAGIDGRNVAINLDGESETALLPFDWLVEAKLVISDKLMQRGAKARAARMGDDQGAVGPSFETAAGRIEFEEEDPQ